MTREPQVLVRQAEEFLHRLGAAQSLDAIVGIDPLFAKFLSQECGLDLDKLKNVSIAAAQTISTLKNLSGIITEENAKAFLAKEG